MHYHFSDFPADVKTLLCFAEFLPRAYKAPKSVLNVLSSVKALHLEAGFDARPFKDQALARWKRALSLTIREAPTQAPPLTISYLV